MYVRFMFDLLLYWFKCVLYMFGSWEKILFLELYEVILVCNEKKGK